MNGENICEIAITWEAIEHEGPGLYDEAYLALLRKQVIAAEQEGRAVCLTPRMEGWCKSLGGEGAPEWTLEKARIEAAKLETTAEKQAAAERMFFFFFFNLFNDRAADNAADSPPDLTVDGLPIQAFLQERYLAAMRHCYRRLKRCKAIVRWVVMSGIPASIVPPEQVKPFADAFAARMREVNAALEVIVAANVRSVPLER